ncbi:uncharacterized protein K460DRAFT_157172 [Cucurbitaria berberidis CBS 394.84]|uniref:Uncharacterized protein n=1 Tax=Cucurbitaria berberidis CBS 394.84 TaxID=1168544 RepID=A0A9P4GF78_9PLEO|nr:uncharacterized protein K460DRAFT_157172 [Cucurbitaria berberidis CBS 394.84]KAF1844075.1 hypothetical protein K460DRAFT_157172 [Cucurbitaria berberidis CBS 394.84]
MLAKQCVRQCCTRPSLSLSVASETPRRDGAIEPAKSLASTSSSPLHSAHSSQISEVADLAPGTLVGHHQEEALVKPPFLSSAHDRGSCLLNSCLARLSEAVRCSLYSACFFRIATHRQVNGLGVALVTSLAALDAQTVYHNSNYPVLVRPGSNQALLRRHLMFCSGPYPSPHRILCASASPRRVVRSPAPSNRSTAHRGFVASGLAAFAGAQLFLDRVSASGLLLTCPLATRYMSCLAPLLSAHL